MREVRGIQRQARLKVERGYANSGVYISLGDSGGRSSDWFAEEDAISIARHILDICGVAETETVAPAPKPEYLRGTGSATIILAKPNPTMIDGACEVIDSWGPNGTLTVPAAVEYAKGMSRCDDGFALYTLAAVVGPRPTPQPLPEREVVVR